MSLLLAALALGIEALVGYPLWLLGKIGHPVVWIGALIAQAERIWNNDKLSFATRRLNGVLALATVLLATLAVSVLVVVVVSYLPSLLSLLILALIASTLLAQRSLDEHVRSVAEALETGDLAEGRKAVASIVGRDPAKLDEAGVARAAIESLSENFSDGIVAPTFWLAIGGLPAIAIYKAINTADSMIGHKSERYLAFGWAAARLDDLANLPGSRLAALLLTAAAAIVPDGAWRIALETVKRDAKKHRSPNAGWPEAAMAGALGFKLNGPRYYGGELRDDHWTGDGRANLNATDIRRALRLYRIACIMQFAVLAILGTGAALLWP